MKKKFDIYKFLETRPLSWSALSSFEYNPEQWYQNYVVGAKGEPNEEMKFGSKVGKRLETDPTYLPMIVRHSKMEHEFRVKYGKIHLVGYADTFCQITWKKLGEYKTGVKPWDKKRVDSHGQLTFYCFMNYIDKKIRPEDVEIDLTWMPTRKVTDEDFNYKIAFVEPIEKHIKKFRTKRTMTDVLQFATRLKKVVVEMEEYANNHD